MFGESSSGKGGKKPTPAQRNTAPAVARTEAPAKASSFGSSDSGDKLAEVNRKLAALEKADSSLKSLQTNAKAPAAAATKKDDFEMSDHSEDEEIEEMLSGSVSSDEGLSVGGAESDSNSFLADSTSVREKSSGQGAKAQKSKNASISSQGSQSIEFSTTEQEISGSQAALDDFDFTARAAPPRGGRKSGW
jgi:hypothetical protein